MAAPVIEVGAAYSGVSTGSINTTAPATVNADDIIVIVAQATNTSGTVAAGFGWPAGFTEIFALNNLSASGIPRGLIGAAWKRADGSEDGATLNVIHNGATGAATHFGARTFRVIGCKTTGNPFTQVVTNNPSNTNTIDFPAITTSGTEKSLLTMHVNSDNNATIASLTNWTIVGVNGNNGTGSDGSNSAFKRENLSAGTYDPASPTIANTNATGWVTFQIEFEPPAAGGGTAWEQPVDDTLSLADSVAFGFSVSPAETLSLADEISGLAFGRGATIADTVGLADALALARGITFAENVPIPDALDVSQGFQRTIEDLLLLADDAAPQTGKGVSIDDSLTLADAISLGRELGVAETVPLADVLNFERDLHVEDVVALDDGRVFVRDLHLADTLGLADASDPELNPSEPEPGDFLARPYDPGRHDR